MVVQLSERWLLISSLLLNSVACLLREGRGRGSAGGATNFGRVKAMSKHHEVRGPKRVDLSEAVAIQSTASRPISCKA